MASVVPSWASTCCSTKATWRQLFAPSSPVLSYDWAVKTRSIDPEVSLPVAKLAYMEELLVKVGNIPKPYDVAGMADPGPRTKALAILGK